MYIYLCAYVYIYLRVHISATYICMYTYMQCVVIDCLYEALHAFRPHVINWDERHSSISGLWNHVAPFPRRHTIIWDGYPLPVWRPGKWLPDDDVPDEVRIAARYLHSGKYGCCVFKGHVAIGLNGLIYAHVGPCLGVDHDSRLYTDHVQDYPLLPGEWGLGDLAYISQDRMLCGVKPAVTEFDLFWNSFIAFYRSRVERVIAKLKNHAWCQTVFRGKFKLLCAFNEISVVQTALELRRDFELDGKLAFEVVGPWRHNFT